MQVLRGELLRVKLFQTHLIVLNTAIFLMQKLDLVNSKIICPEKIIVDHLIINSIRDKFDTLSFITDSNIDILLI